MGVKIELADVDAAIFETVEVDVVVLSAFAIGAAIAKASDIRKIIFVFIIV